MPPQPPHSLDFVAFVVFLLSLVFGPQAATILGPYAVILVCATAGASFALYRADPLSRGAALLFFARLVAMALFFSGGLSLFLERWVGEGTAQYSVPFVAFAIGLVGDDWPSAFRWLKAKAVAWFDKKAEVPK